MIDKSQTPKGIFLLLVILAYLGIVYTLQCPQMDFFWLSATSHHMSRRPKFFISSCSMTTSDTYPHSLPPGSPLLLLLGPNFLILWLCPVSPVLLNCARGDVRLVDLSHRHVPDFHTEVENHFMRDQNHDTVLGR
jgi:hypothetical protein